VHGDAAISTWAALLLGLPLPLLYPLLADWLSSNNGNLQGFGLHWAAMPFAVSLLFLPAFLLATRLLRLMPQPDTDDERERCRRAPMDAAARWAFLQRFLPGLCLLLLSYFLLTGYRNYQDYFGPELFLELGYSAGASLFTQAALPVAFGVLAAMALLAGIRSSFWGLLACFALMLSGLVLQGLLTIGLNQGWVSGKWWMVGVSLGAYLAYVPFGSVIFDRVIARTRFVGTAVFAIYLADATGYLGTVLVKLYADVWSPAVNVGGRLDFFIAYTWVNVGVGIVCLLLGAVYFLRQQPISATSESS
jgi:hypothetical protein